MEKMVLAGMLVGFALCGSICASEEFPFPENSNAKDVAAEARKIVREGWRYETIGDRHQGNFSHLENKFLKEAAQALLVRVDYKVLSLSDMVIIREDGNIFLNTNHPHWVIAQGIGLAIKNELWRLILGIQ